MSDAAAACATGPDVPWPQLTGQAVSDMLGFSPRWLSKLVDQGYAERKENGLFDLGEVALGYIRFLKDADRRAARNAPSDGLRQAQIRKLEIENARMLDSLIETDLAEKCARQMMTVIRDVFLNLEPLPDPVLDAAVKKRIADAIEATDGKFAKFFAGIRVKTPVVFDDEDEAGEA